MKNLYQVICATVLMAMVFALGCGKGADGAPGTALQSSHQCSSSMTISGAQLLLYYELDKFSTGDKFISCVVSDAGKQLSHSGFLRSGDPDFAHADCGVIADLDTVSFGAWHFTDDGTATAVVYQDASSSLNGTTHAFTTAECKDY